MSGSRIHTTIIAILLLVMTFAFAPVVQAANVTVGNGTPGSCTQKALRDKVKAVNAANGGEITFNCGANPHTIRVSAQFVFDKTGSYTLDGGGLITLDGQGQTRLLYTASGKNINLTVQNITLINGRAASDPAGERAANQGGALYSGFRNTLTVRNVTFRDNFARAERHPYHGGGALAIDTTSTVLIEDSTFINNRSPNGGAINNLLSVLTIRRSRFTANVSTSPSPGGGGAVYNDAGKLTIVDTIINGNRAANLGGGIFTWAHNVNGEYSGETVINRSVLANNFAEHGGGLWKGGHYVLRLLNSSVTGNRAQTRGAGISGTGPGPNFIINNSTIAHNSVLRTGSAAGVFSANNSSTITNSTIAYNTVPNDASSVGAAIHGNVTIARSIIAYNTGGWNNQWSCMGTTTNDGNNLQFPGNTCGSIPVQDARVSNVLVPALNTLEHGQTQFLALRPDSPALNAYICTGSDQRGIERPFGGSCDIGAIEMNGSMPGGPVITYPVNAGFVSGANASPTITWNPVNDATQYRVQVNDMTAGQRLLRKTMMAGEVCGVGCAYALATDGVILVNNRRYRVVVFAINEFGNAKTTITFTAQFPGKPTLSSPANNTVVSQTPTFEWSAVEGAQEYRLIFVRNANGAITRTGWMNTLNLCSGQTCTYTLNEAQALRRGKYAWRVEARNALGKQRSAKGNITIQVQ